MKLLFTGDSITANLLIDPLKGYVNLVSKGLNCTLGTDAINTAVSGYTSKDILNNIQTLILDHNPVHCIMMIGTNDFLTDCSNGVDPLVSTNNYIGRMRLIDSRLQASNIKITFLSPIVTLKPYQQIRSKMYSDALQDMCTDTGSNFINTNAGFLYYMNRYSEAQFRPWYVDDNHPSEIGHYILSYFILKTQITLPS